MFRRGAASVRSGLRGELLAQLTVAAGWVGLLGMIAVVAWIATALYAGKRVAGLPQACRSQRRTRSAASPIHSAGGNSDFRFQEYNVRWTGPFHSWERRHEQGIVPDADHRRAVRCRERLGNTARSQLWPEVTNKKPIARDAQITPAFTPDQAQIAYADAKWVVWTTHEALDNKSKKRAQMRRTRYFRQKLNSPSGPAPQSGAGLLRSFRKP